jgi:hypothetical protein
MRSLAVEVVPSAVSQNQRAVSLRLKGWWTLGNFADLDEEKKGSCLAPLLNQLRSMVYGFSNFLIGAAATNVSIHGGVNLLITGTANLAK